MIGGFRFVPLENETDEHRHSDDMIDGELTPEVIDDILAFDPINDVRVLPIALSMDPPQGVDVERICLDVAFHEDAWVRGNSNRQSHGAPG